MRCTTYADESKMNGQMVKSRYVIKVAGKDAYTFEWAIQGPDGTWKTLGGGRARAQSRTRGGRLCDGTLAASVRTDFARRRPRHRSSRSSCPAEWLR